MNNRFKRFFGFSEDFKGGMPPDGFKDDDEDDSDAFKDGSFHHNFFTDELSSQDASRIFSEFEEILKNVEGMFRFGFDLSAPPIEGLQEYHMEGREDGKSLRDQMLKTPDKDSRIIIPHSSYSTNVIKSKSSSILVGSEGLVKSEVHRTMKDSDGNTNVTVRRTLGDQTHAVTTKTDGTGKSEKLEEFVNMDEKSLDDFEQKWNAQRRRTLLSEIDTPYDPLTSKNEQLGQILPVEKSAPDRSQSLDSSANPIIQGYNFIRRLFGND